MNNKSNGNHGQGNNGSNGNHGQGNNGNNGNHGHVIKPGKSSCKPC